MEEKEKRKGRDERGPHALEAFGIWSVGHLHGLELKGGGKGYREKNKNATLCICMEG